MKNVLDATLPMKGLSLFGSNENQLTAIGHIYAQTSTAEEDIKDFPMTGWRLLLKTSAFKI